MRKRGRIAPSLPVLILVIIPRRIRRNTAPPSSPLEWNTAAPHCIFTAPGRYLLRDESIRGLDHRCGRVVKGLPAPQVAVPDRNTHRLVGVHDKDRYELHAIGAGDAVVTACLGIEHAIGVAPKSVVQRDVIFMLANTLLAAVLGEDILGVQVAPVAIAAHKARRHAVGADDHADLALTE